LSVSEAAKLANKSPRQMRRRILALARAFPELNLVAWTVGPKGRIGKYEINRRALRECMSVLAAHDATEEIQRRLNGHEGIFKGLRARIKRLENRVSARSLFDESRT
jgi:hypothetical protein